VVALDRIYYLLPPEELLRDELPDEELLEELDLLEEPLLLPELEELLREGE
jgi:hypothetical protein